jgi:putative redox protein
MPITAVVRSRTDSLRQEIVVNDRHTFVVDEPQALGGTDTAPAPFDLLAASLAGCIVITIRMYARRKGWQLDDVGVEVTLDRESRPQCCAFTVRLPDGLTEEQYVRLEHVAQKCPVHRTLKHGLEFEHRVVVEAPA